MILILDIESDQIESVTAVAEVFDILTDHLKVGPKRDPRRQLFGSGEQERHVALTEGSQRFVELVGPLELSRVQRKHGESHTRKAAKRRHESECVDRRIVVQTRGLDLQLVLRYQREAGRVPQRPDRFIGYSDECTAEPDRSRAGVVRKPSAGKSPRLILRENDGRH